ncbi:MazG nucleotide pyrophosphohydrolase domain-containing protein [Enterococcus quebecensis]|uniref:NTP pyrophosphohydrolase MazG-like domain-containing protein n=1 Tax=Enterococcus quebecensis TaxID=903983 RepID=A0A1E5GS48_9ENTE|nr:MazG-like family protein [Enterococcus quebecensis]OEG15544.1 hypothetical protein BCR23_08750 [Enterococcus quebecensis]OJG74673.1 hypothetical protein RV12_GL002428 [Enterococcus quebecensis]
MDLQHYQHWISNFYKKRGWYALNPFIRVGFLAEETGEVARAVRALEIGRDRPDEEEKNVEHLVQDLTEELGDVLDNVFILADKYDIHFEDILTSHKKKLEERFSEVNLMKEGSSNGKQTNN